MIEADLIIQNCTILTMDSQSSLIEKGSIAIRDKLIIAVEKEAKRSLIKAKETINGRGKAAIPGLINCHTHVAMTLFRGLAEDRPLDSWLRDTIWPIEAKLAPSNVYDGALLGCLEMIKSGTTCFADLYFHEDMVAEAAEKAGLRAVLSEGIIEAGDTQKGERMLKESINMAERLNGKANDRIRALLGPHAIYSCSPDLLRRIRDAASRLKLGVHIHLAESKGMSESLRAKYGLREVELLEFINFLDGLQVLAAHCIHLSENEMRILANRDVKVSYNPVANMKLGVGAPKINQLLELGIIVGLGTDGPASNNTLDMFETMKLATLLQKASCLDPSVLPTETVLRMATIDAAKALGLDTQIGSLEVGKKADIILLDLQKPHLTPNHDLKANIVYSGRGSDVDTVIVDGCLLMKEREIQTIKEQEIIEKAGRTASRIASV